MAILYLWKEGFEDGKLHDVAIFSPDLGISILRILIGVGRCLLQCECRRCGTCSSAYMSELPSKQRRALAGRSDVPVTTDERLEIFLTKAKECLKSSSASDELDDLDEDEEDDGPTTDGSDTDEEDFRPTLKFQIRLLMQLVPSMDRTFIQASDTLRQNSQLPHNVRDALSDLEEPGMNVDAKQGDVKNTRNLMPQIQLRSEMDSWGKPPMLLSCH
jgi:hypothetical protein